MTAARQVIAGRTYLMTRRCTQRQMLLRPEPLVEQIYLYCLGEAVQRFQMTLHGFEAMSNHQHSSVTDNHANYPEYLAHFHKMISKAMNVLRGRRENFWATEQPNAVYLVEAEDRFAKLIYLLANPVADHLVDRVTDWPGASSYGLHMSGRTVTVKRPKCFFADDGDMPEEVTLRIERPAGFEHLSEDEWRAKIADAVRVEEERARETRRRLGWRVLGRKGVLRASPTDVPSTPEPLGGIRPNIACRRRERRLFELAALLDFRIRRKDALRRLRIGERDVIFPFGTYRIWGVFTTAPGPTAPLAS